METNRVLMRCHLKFSLLFSTKVSSIGKEVVEVFMDNFKRSASAAIDWPSCKEITMSGRYEKALGLIRSMAAIKLLASTKETELSGETKTS